jgi:YggT family protein
MISEIVKLLVDTLGALVVGACLLRLWLQWQRIGMRNPVGEFSMALTDWIVKPLRRVIPGAGGIDWSSVIAGYLTSFFCVLVWIVVAAALGPYWRLPGAEIFLGLALVWLLKWSIWTVVIVLILSAALSWLNPFSPVLPIFDALAGPILRPIRRVIGRAFGTMGRFDFSPLVAVLALYILQYLLEGLSIRFIGTY